MPENPSDQGQHEPSAWGEQSLHEEGFQVSLNCDILILWQPGSQAAVLAALYTN